MQSITAKSGKVYFELHGEKQTGSDSSSPYSSREILEHYFKKSYFGDFRYTPAVRPDIANPFFPREGYICTPPDKEEGDREFTLEIAVDANRIMEIFLGLVSLLSDNISMVLEESRGANEPRVSQNDRVEKVIAVSGLLDFENTVMGDGFSGIGFFSGEDEQEIFLDQHKLIYVYAPSTAKFSKFLESRGLKGREDLGFIREYPHFHFGASDRREKVDALKRAFALDPCNVIE